MANLAAAPLPADKPFWRSDNTAVWVLVGGPLAMAAVWFWWKRPL